MQAPSKNPIEDTRRPFAGMVAIVLLDGLDHPMPVQHLEALDLSSGGVRVVSPDVMHDDSHGAVMIRRSGGDHVIVGVRVRHCVYVGRMEYHVGLEFTNRSPQIELTHFYDENGHLPDLFDLKTRAA